MFFECLLLQGRQSDRDSIFQRVELLYQLEIVHVTALETLDRLFDTLQGFFTYDHLLLQPVSTCVSTIEPLVGFVLDEVLNGAMLV
jgi:hypothetical protein